MTTPLKTPSTPRPVPATMVRPSAPTPPPKFRRSESSGTRPLHIVMFAVIACGLLVAAAFAFDVPSKTRKAGSVDEIAIDPQTYALASASNVTRLATLPDLPVGDDPLAGMDRAAQAELQKALADALAALDAALAEAALPTVPADYLPGSEVEVKLPTARPYPVPELPDVVLGDGTLRLPNVGGSASPVGPREGTPLDDVLGQLETVQAALEDLLGESPLQGLPVGGDALGGTPLGPLTGPSQVQDANDAVDPDEEGALRASRHASELLGMTGSAYDQTSADLERLLALYESLAQQVADAIEEARALEDDATAAIEALLEQRIAEIQAQAAGLEAAASRLVAAHVKAVEDAEKAALGTVQKAVDDHVASVTAQGDEAVRGLLAQAASVQATAEERRSEIDAIVQAALVDLDDGTPESVQALQAVQASAAAARLKVDREAAQQVEALQAQVAAVRAEVAKAEARAMALADGARDQVNATVSEALTLDDDVRDYLIDVAQQQGRLLQEREVAMATEATAQVADLVDSHVEDVIATGIAATQGVDGLVDGASALVAQVEGLVVSEAGKDLDYLVKVSEDYGRVPTEDRKERASHWSGLAVDLGGILEQAVVDGHGIEGLAQDVLEAAAAAEADIAALT